MDKKDKMLINDKELMDDEEKEEEVKLIAIYRQLYIYYLLITNSK